MQTLTIRKPDDFHTHLRQGEMLENVVKHSVSNFARVLVMPNTQPPIITGEDVKRYETEIKNVLDKQSLQLDLVMTIKVTDVTTPEIVKDAYQAGAKAGKMYPVGVTTNSEDGVSDVRKLENVFAAMEEVGMVLCLHGEKPGEGIDDLNREKEFLPDLKWLSETFPKLKIVLEHCSTKDAVQTVKSLPENVAATITVHHLFVTHEDAQANPHDFCKPIAKTPEDREALIQAAISGSPKFFLGTDSAPHTVRAKEEDHAAGVFTAPVAISLLAQLFEQHDALDKLEAFVSQYGAEFYELPLNEGKITLKKESWTIPDQYDGVVPFKSGETLAWKIE